MKTKFQVYDKQNNRVLLNYTLPESYKTISDVKEGDIIKKGGQKYKIVHYGMDNRHLKSLGYQKVTIYVISA